MTKTIRLRSPWIAPFPRLRFRLRHGHWCEHRNWTNWRMINNGIGQVRYCVQCDYMESR